MSATLAAMGNTMEQSIGLMTAGIELMPQNASRVARALRTIGSNLSKFNEEGESNLEVISALEDTWGKINETTGASISLIDEQTGQLKNTYDILKDLHSVWGLLEQDQRNYIAELIAGKNNLDVFHAILGNFNSAIGANETAMNSAGSAARENAKYMESLEAKVAALKQTFQELSTNLIDDDIAGSFLDIANSLLRLVNTDVGRILAIATALTAVTVAVTALWAAVNKDGRLFAVFTKGATSVLGKLTPLGIGLTALIGILTVLIAFAPQIKDFFDRIQNPIENATKKLEENAIELENTKNKLKELESTPWYDRTPEINKEIQELKEYNAELEKSNEELEKRKAKAAYKEVNRASGVVPVSRGFQQVPVDDDSGHARRVFGSAQAALDNLSKARGEVYATVEEAKEAGVVITEVFLNVSVSAEKYYAHIIEEQKKFNEQLANGQELTDEEIALGNERNDILTEFVENVDLGSKHSKDFSDSILDSAKSASVLVEENARLKEALKENDRIQRIATSGIKIAKEEASAFTSANGELSSSIVELNGQFYMEQEALYGLASAGNIAAQNLIRSQADATRAAINETKLRIQAFIAEQKIYTGARGVISNFVNKAKVRFLEGRVGGLEAELSALEGQIGSWSTTGNSAGTSSGGGGSKGGGGGGGGSQPSVLEAIKKLTEQMNHKIFLLTKQDAEANASAIIDIYIKMQGVVRNKANELRAKGYAETSEEIMELQKMWWGYSDEIKKVYDNIAEIEKKRLEEAEKALKDHLEKQAKLRQADADAQKVLMDEANAEADAYKIYAQFVKDAIDEKIAGYQAEIDALDKANEEREKEIALQERINNLAKAKSTQVMVFKDGRFQYVNDIDAVSAAQNELAEYKRERQLEREKKYWQDRIDELENYKDEWNDFTKEYEKNADMQVLIQSNLFTNEDLIFSKRITSAQNFASKYEEAMNRAMEAAKKMEQYQNQANAFSQSASNVGSSAGSGTDWSQMWRDADAAYKSKDMTKEQADAIKDYAHSQKTKEMAGTGAIYNPSTGTWSGGSSSSSGGGGGADWSQKWRDVDAMEKAGTISKEAAAALKNEYHQNKTKEMAGTGATYNPSTGTWSGGSYADGTLSSSAGLALMGENGPEIGVLKGGSGIIPADITKNLWALGTNPYAFMSDTIRNLGGMQSNSTIYQFDIDGLQLPQVNDAPSFIEGLRRYAHQYSTQRN